MGNDFQRVKDRADIAKIVGELVAIKPSRSRGEFVGLCPFHQDHTPSMNVVPTKGLFHCFSCQAGGDVFTFVQRLLGYSALESLRYVAERAGVTLEERHKEAPTDGVSNADLRRACEFAAGYYATILTHHRHGLEARAAVERRGITPGVVVTYGVGAAAQADGLLLTAKARGFPRELLDAAGIIHKDGGDAMADRLVFPIRDAAGKPIAFGGRVFKEGDDRPKYMNTRETAIFAKGQVVYGLSEARMAVRELGRAVMVEGYTDVLAARRIGWQDVVGYLGTAITEDHVRVLSRLAHTIVIVPDRDDAGTKAAIRAVEMCVRGGVACQVAELNGTGKDLDEVAKGFGYAHGSVKLDLHEGLAWRFRKVLDGLEGGERAVKTEAEARAMARAVKGLAPVRRHAALEALAKASGMPIDVIAEEAKVGGVA